MIENICTAEPNFESAMLTKKSEVFLRKCLSKKPIERMTAQEALRSPFILSASSTLTSMTADSPCERHGSLTDIVFPREKSKTEDFKSFYDES